MELIAIAITLALSIGLGLAGTYAMMSTAFFLLERAIGRALLRETMNPHTPSS